MLSFLAHLKQSNICKRLGPKLLTFWQKLVWRKGSVSFSHVEAELALVIDASTPFRNATYKLEGFFRFFIFPILIFLFFLRRQLPCTLYVFSP